MAETIEKKERKLDLGTRESIYQPEDASLIFPYAPKFNNFAVSHLFVNKSPIGTYLLCLRINRF